MCCLKVSLAGPPAGNRGSWCACGLLPSRAQDVLAVGCRQHQGRQPSGPHSDLTLCLLKQDPCTEVSVHTASPAQKLPSSPTTCLHLLRTYRPPRTLQSSTLSGGGFPSQTCHTVWGCASGRARSDTSPIPPAGPRRPPGSSLKLIRQRSQPWTSGSCTTVRFYRPIAEFPSSPELCRCNL